MEYINKTHKNGGEIEMGRNILPSKICNNEIKWKREKGDGERKIETEREKAKERKVVEKNKRRRYKRTHFFL